MSKKSSNSKAKKSAKDDGARVVSDNRKARHKYEILEQIECGIILAGSEVKSLREGNVSLDEAYGRIDGGKLWLVGCDISEYRQASIWNHMSRRPRQLLVHKRQLLKLKESALEKGLTLVPLRLLLNERGIFKAVLGVCRGKKLHDKRETLKKQDVKRQIDRAMKQR